MKEIKLLESWIDSIVNEKIEDRPLARSQDIQYQASRKYPDRSPEQALQLYVSDKMQDTERMDLEQNKLINAQSRENEKLRRSLSDLSRELSDHEKTAMDTEREVQRLRDLSAKLKPSSDIQQATVKASQEQVQRMLNDLESLKAKPGMDPEKYNELKAQIEKARQGQSTGPQIQELQKMLNALDRKQAIDDEMFNKLNQKLKSLETLGLEKIGGLESELEKKEQRFRSSITRNAKKIEQWGNKFKDIDKQISNTEQKANEILSNVQNQSDVMMDKINKIAARVRQVSPAAGVTSIPLSRKATGMRDKADQDEVYQAIAANQSVSGEELTGQQDVSPNGGGPARSTAVRSLRGLKMNEELEGPGTGPRQDHIETHLIPDLIEVYKRTYPVDLKRWSVEQLREIMRRTIDGSLLLDADDVDSDDDEGLENLINKYLAMCRNWLRKTKPVNPELPGIPQEPPATRPATTPVAPVQQARPGQANWPPGPPGSRNMTESLVMSYTKQLNKLTGGF